MSYNLSNMIVVGASDPADDSKASFSNFGKVTVDLFAPGVNIYSTVLGQRYGSKSGTSVAAPHVAGETAANFRDQQQTPSFLAPILTRCPARRACCLASPLPSRCCRSAVGLQPHANGHPGQGLAARQRRQCDLACLGLRHRRPPQHPPCLPDDAQPSSRQCSPPARVPGSPGLARSGRPQRHHPARQRHPPLGGARGGLCQPPVVSASAARSGALLVADSHARLWLPAFHRGTVCGGFFQTIDAKVSDFN